MAGLMLGGFTQRGTVGGIMANTAGYAPATPRYQPPPALQPQPYLPAGPRKQGQLQPTLAPPAAAGGGGALSQVGGFPPPPPPEVPGGPGPPSVGGRIETPGGGAGMPSIPGGMLEAAGERGVGWAEGATRQIGSQLGTRIQPRSTAVLAILGRKAY